MVLLLREGRFDNVIAGKEIGGMQIFTEPPNVDNIKKLASQKKQRAEAGGGPSSIGQRSPTPTAVPAQPGPVVSRPAALAHFTLHVLRSLTGGPERYDPPGTEVLIGGAGGIARTAGGGTGRKRQSARQRGQRAEARPQFYS